MREYNVRVSFEVDPPLKDGDFDRIADAVFQFPSAALSSTMFAGFTTETSIVVNVGAERLIDAVSGTVNELERMLTSVVSPSTTVTLVGAEACTYEEFLRRMRAPVGVDVVGVDEVAELIERSPKKTARLLSARSAPRPYAELAIGPVWNRAWLHWFIEENSRTKG